MSVMWIVGLIEITLPGGTVRLSEGGVVSWGADVFRASDPVWGSIAQADDYAEAAAAQVPDARWTMNLPDDVDPADVAASSYQGARVRMWMPDYNHATATVSGSEDLEFLGQIDTFTVTVGGQKQVAVTAVPLAERLFEWKTGNSLNPTFHKRCFPGETGEDNATSMTTSVAWGVAQPASTSASGGGGGVGGNSALDNSWAQLK